MKPYSLETMETLSPNSPVAPPALLPATAVAAFLPPPPAPALPRARMPLVAGVSRPPAREKDSVSGMKYEGVIDWRHYGPNPRAEQARFTSVSVGDMYWRIVAPIRAQELVRPEALRRLAEPRRPAEPAPVLRPPSHHMPRATTAPSVRPQPPLFPSAALDHAAHAQPLHARARPRRLCSGTSPTSTRSTGRSPTSARRARRRPGRPSCPRTTGNKAARRPPSACCTPTPSGRSSR